MTLELPKRLSKEHLESKQALLAGVRQYPNLEERLYQHFLITLHSRGIISIDEIYEKIATDSGSRLKDLKSADLSENIHTPSRWSDKERRAINKLILKVVAINFSPEQVNDNISMVIRREEVKNLEDIARLPNVSFDLLARKVKEYCSLPETSMKLPISDILATRVCLQHHFISDQLDFIGVAKKYIRISDLNRVANNTIGPKGGMGRIGGKAAGMILGNRIVETHKEELGKALPFAVRFPESHYLRADLYHAFVHRNGLSHVYDQKYKDTADIARDHPVIREVFKNGTFSQDIIDALKQLLNKFGKSPLIVRSSSLLEDNFGAAFCGKYRSIYLANQGTEKQRLTNLVTAITEVYAGILHPDPISYRRKRNLLDYDEMMGILIQKVIGQRFGDFFFPLFSGVAYSRNEYRWSPRIKKEDGMLRMVLGLGTRAVDRVSTDYPRIVALTEPTLRHHGSVEDLLKYSQHYVDLINLKNRTFETIKLKDLPTSPPIPHLDKVVSIYEEGYVKPIIGKFIDVDNSKLCVTFDKLIANTGFVEQMKWTLSILQKFYGCPVDIEFTSDGTHFYLLQCRPLSKQLEWERVQIPTDIAESDKIFSANRDVQNGMLENIEYVIYAPAMGYDKIRESKDKLRVGRAISVLNQKLAGKQFILMGPGRFGSNDLNLGIKVFYNDISNTRALIEIAREKEGYVPELSFGTHFFQDLVESQIFYLPLYPDEPQNIFSEDFLLGSKNSLKQILPEFADLEEALRVIHVPKVSKKRALDLYMDGENMQALAFLHDPEE